ncbi:hypothetical protein VC83_03107 [Pseudogymnoascus destructans]|uniref:Uncharacterized protein n=2 Tax=Pseudogymnoascus destructans TaxID=655981 RepID=L8FUF6_PSED2|nr:uncharacterized protein VC83_03107 [Pseudogymnoascus destructans]ELR04580.1 hypothetical protein GMDG_06864 [Pseudogymnoascus destructans 20631-21]OAF59905.1 hypothetical protein VC83_03107 [Pseudogymnoascus destructans]
MKFSTPLFVLGFALTATASPLEVRDLTTFKTIIANIQADADALDVAVKAYTSGGGASVQAASDKLVATINASVTAANAQPVLSDVDALGLISSVNTANDHVTIVVNDTIAKKNAFVANCLGPAVLADFQAQLTGAKALATVVTAKVSTLLKPVAAQLAGKITANIQRGFDAYTGVAGC